MITYKAIIGLNHSTQYQDKPQSQIIGIREPIKTNKPRNYKIEIGRDIWKWRKYRLTLKRVNWLKAMGDRLKVIGRMANFDFSVDLKVYLSIFNFYPKSTKLYTLNK